LWERFSIATPKNVLKKSRLKIASHGMQEFHNNNGSAMTTPADASGMSQQPVQSKGSLLAMFSLILGILSLCLWFLGAIPAIILGIVALTKISESQGRLRGKALAIGGIITGAIGLLFAWVVWIMAAAALDLGEDPYAVPFGAGFGGGGRNEFAQRRALVNNARQIDAAIDQWTLENDIGSGPVNCASVAVYLKPGPLRDKVAALGESGGSISTVLPICDIQIGNVGSTQVIITPEAKQALPFIYDWGNY
jgi:hypothetical protein